MLDGSGELAYLKEVMDVLVPDGMGTKGQKGKTADSCPHAPSKALERWADGILNL